MKRPPRWAWVSLCVAASAAAVVGKPALHLVLVHLRDRSDRLAPPPGWIDDASTLQQTRVAEVWSIPGDTAAAELELAALVQRASREGLGVSIGGSRHSMGGHSIAADGVSIDMLAFQEMELDEERNILHVQAGARWSRVVPYLNARGRSVAVMQSNNSFTVGGSISANCHGWQAQRPPISSTVESFRIMLADGSIVRCSREENGELFSLALGGYGLFGIILDVDLRVVPNEAYRLERVVMPSDRYVASFDKHVLGSGDVAMAYGRLSVAPEGFLEEAILSVFHKVPTGSGEPSATAFPEVEGLTRSLFRGQVGSDYGKRLRWMAERHLGGALSLKPVYRNQLLGEPVAVFENRSAASTDILHEYFLPPESFAAFLDELRVLVPRHGGDLLNVTVRDVRRDDDTFLRYADRDMFALVLLFNQPRSAAGEAAMQAMTQELIDAALGRGGRYYLPYRLHATPEQMQAAYPKASRFFELKRRYDPRETFRNAFYVKYGITRSKANQPGTEAPTASPRP